MSKTTQDLKKTPLYEKHLEAGARMVPFSGWSMPVQYSGIIEEHLHTREEAGLFDICHMGEFIIKGDKAQDDVEKLVTCRIDDMPDGKCRYGFLLNENGGIIDDLIVFKINPREFMLVVNAGTREKDASWIKGHLSEGTLFVDDSDNIAKIDLQGPKSMEVIARIADKEAVEGLKRFTFVKTAIEGEVVLLSRTGYTGENGYELFFSVSAAPLIWDLLISQGEVKPVGLGARDTLRLEMGYSLYGSDIDDEHTPLDAGLERFIYFEKDFIGKESLLRQKDSGTDKVLAGFICDGRRSARSHFEVRDGEEAVGEVTSGAFSPCLKKGIGICYIKKDRAEEGKEVMLTDGRVEIKAKIKALPILDK